MNIKIYLIAIFVYNIQMAAQEHTSHNMLPATCCLIMNGNKRVHRDPKKKKKKIGNENNLLKHVFS